MSQKFKKKSSEFVRPSRTKHTVNGVELEFFAIPMELVFELADTAAPIFGLLAIILSGNEDMAKRTVQHYNPSDEDAGGAQTIIEPTPELSRFRAGQLRDAITQVIGHLTEKDTRLLAAKLVMSSLRNVYERPEGGFTPEHLHEFIDDPDLDIETLMSLLRGVFSASKGVLGPFAANLGVIANHVQGLAQERLGMSLTSLETSGSEPKI